MLRRHPKSNSRYGCPLNIATDNEVRTLTDDKTYIQTDFQPSPQFPVKSPLLYLVLRLLNLQVERQTGVNPLWIVHLLQNSDFLLQLLEFIGERIGLFELRSLNS